MSKEQWGHGYYSGMSDAISGTSIGRISKENISEVSEKIVMLLEDYQKWRINRDPIPLSEVKGIISSISKSEITNHEIELILNYIWRNEPRGAYISGTASKFLDYKNDYLIV